MKVLITLVKILTFPVYIIVYFILSSLKAIFNVCIGSVFFEHTITRREKFIVRIFVGFIGFILLVAYVMFVLSMVFYKMALVKQYLYLCLLQALPYFKKIIPVIILDIAILLYDELSSLKKPKELHRISADKRDAYRKIAIDNDKIFVGTTLDKAKKPLYLTNAMRSLHTLGIGTTGAGKTEGFLKPWILQDILRGYGAIIVDPKGDVKLFHEIYAYHKKYNKHNQNFYYLNLGDPENSNSYNPIFRGTANELKDRIMNMVSWGSERYYRIQSEMYLFNLLLAIESLDKKITIEDLYLLFTQPRALMKLTEMLKDDVLIAELNTMLANYDVFRKECQSLISNLGMLCKGPLSKIVNTYNPDIDLLEAYEKNDVLFFSLPTNLLTDTARAFGRMLLMDLQSTSGYIHLYNKPRRFYPVFIDEFGEFAIDDFISWLNKARSSGYSIHIAFQEAADLEKIDRTFMKQVIGNTSIKVVFCVHDNETAESLSKILGTITVKKETERIDKTSITQFEGMVGSIREVEEFRVHPNVIKNELRQGQCLIWGKIPDFYYSLLNTDFIEINSSGVEYKLKHSNISRVNDSDCLKVREWFDGSSSSVSVTINEMQKGRSEEEIHCSNNLSKETDEVFLSSSQDDEVIHHIDTIELNNLHAEVDEDRNGIDVSEEIDKFY